MSTSKYSVSQIVEVLLVLVVILLIVGQFLGQPILLAFVETGSMSPRLEPGDGFVAVPTQLDGSIEEGDVIVYEAEIIEGGGLTTHRVVDKTNQGYITKGDANPFTDQDNDEPPVKRGQVVAKSLQVNGYVVVIPHLGTAVERTQSFLGSVQQHLAALLGTNALLGIQGLAYLFFAATLLWYGVGEWRHGTTKCRDRETSRRSGADARLVVGAFAALLVIGATAAMIMPADTQEYGVVSAEFESDKPTVIPMGESNNVTYPIGNSGVIPVITYLEPASDGVEVQPHETYVQGRTVENATVTLHAPPRTGYYRLYVVEHRYLAVLPLPVIRGLYEFHPWAPIVVIDALIAVPFYLVGVALVGRGRIRRRSKSRDLSAVTRVRRGVRSLYR